ncbi:MAG: alpha-2-macroglobulin family protein, partial [Verrucomicrobiota bacterium]
ISGGSNVGDIREFFWKWRRHHRTRTEHNLLRPGRHISQKNKTDMQYLGVFGASVVDEVGQDGAVRHRLGAMAPGSPMLGRSRNKSAMTASLSFGAVADKAVEEADFEGASFGESNKLGGGGGAATVVEPMIRKNFADTAFWAAALKTDDDGYAEVSFKMPENLAGWKVKAWALGHGTRVGEGEAEVVTAKNILVRLQAPRFFVEKDEVVLSGNVHNYLDHKKKIKARLELDGSALGLIKGAQEQVVEIEANGEMRVDWRVKVLREGEAVVRMLALTDEESDAVEMTFPVYVHGMLKTESFSGVLRPRDTKGQLSLTVPQERRVDDTRLEIRYSPTLAGAMVDALPYLADYPYGCTEQTLSRFLPAAMTQKILLDMGIDLEDVKKKRSNLNAQEIGDDAARAAQWKRYARNPVWDREELNDMVEAGVKRLEAMQLADGGWGWFSGWGERSSAHTTAYVVHGLQMARGNDVQVQDGTINRGVSWLKRYQKTRIAWIKAKPHRGPNNQDAFVFMVLVDARVESAAMQQLLYQKREVLSLYGKAMFGIALHNLGEMAKRDMLIRNIEQFLVEDEENQTAYLEMQNGGYWWSWYGSEYEAHAYYLKLLTRTDPKGGKARGLVKYLLNNRKHATYWKSTRDTAVCLEAFAEFLRATGEHEPDTRLTVLIDGRKVKEVHITKENLFTFDNKVLLEGKALTHGAHVVEFRKEGEGPLYFNAYLTNFTLEDHITKAGLEVKVERKVYRLNPVDKQVKAQGGRGQAVDHKVEKYERELLANLATLKSGDLVEVELEIESKNDYEYLIFEDMKASGFEPVEVRSGYNGNDMNAYVEFRDEKVVFFVRSLARGKHSVSYRLRAEIPGIFSALPTRGFAMYAPELKGNSDEIKLRIED